VTGYHLNVSSLVPVTRLGPAARIGLLADTHCHRPEASDLPGSVLEAFRGIDLVIHLGDMGEAAVLDRLEGVAGVVATRGRDDPSGDPRIVSGARVIEAGDLVVGALFDLPSTGIAVLEEDRLAFAGGPLEDLMSRVFGRRVDVVAFGATHRDMVAQYRGVLFVNPGSATLPARPGPGGTGTAALLDLRAGIATVEILHV
jgi:uncharacterized protein